jgi:single-strand DNA-binding protein
MLNVVHLVGRVTADPTTVKTTSGTQLCRFSIAVDRRNKDTPDCIDIITFGRLGETCARYLTEGRLVSVTARLRQNTWQDKTTGEHRTRLDVIASEVGFLDRAARDEPAGPHRKEPHEPDFGDEPFWAGQQDRDGPEQTEGLDDPSSFGLLGPAVVMWLASGCAPEGVIGSRSGEHRLVVHVTLVFGTQVFEHGDHVEYRDLGTGTTVALHYLHRTAEMFVSRAESPKLGNRGRKGGPGRVLSGDTSSGCPLPQLHTDDGV